MNTIKLNSVAPENVYLQTLLGLKVDGIFGPGTEKAVKEFQKSVGLKDDGIVGARTWGKLLEKYPQRKIEEKDYEEAAKALGCDVAAVKAIKEVESGKSAFLGSGFPSLLFEAHIFYKYLGASKAEKLRASHPGIISKSWNRHLYKGGEKEVDRLREAWAISPSAASMSASFGAFQICGFNYKACGYSSPLEYLGGVWKSEAEQLRTFISFIKSSGIAPYLRQHNWAEVARRYNGAGYKANNYDTKLATAYKKWSSK
jgi:hypothetical protein